MTAQNNNALLFDGTDDYAEIFQYSATHAIEPGNFTIEAEINATPTGQDMAILSNGTPGVDFFFFGLDGNGFFTLKWDNGEYICTEQNLYDEQCHRLSAVVSETTVKMYIDGVEKCVGDYGILHDIQNYQRMGLGMNHITQDYPFSGIIDDVRFWARALSASEISSYQCPLQANIPAFEDLYSYFPLDEGGGFHAFGAPNSPKIAYLPNAASTQVPQWTVSCTNCAEPERVGTGTPPTCIQYDPCEYICNGGFELYDLTFDASNDILKSAKAFVPDVNGVTDVTEWKVHSGAVNSGVNFSPNGFYVSVNPNNSWGLHVAYPWNYQTTANHKYISMAAFDDYSNVYNKYEPELEAELSSSLVAGNSYELSFQHLTFRWKSNTNVLNSQYFIAYLTNSSNQKHQLFSTPQVLPDISTAGNDWHQYSHIFTVPSNSIVYDKLVIQMVTEDFNGNPLHTVPTGTSAISFPESFIDDISLKEPETLPAALVLGDAHPLNTQQGENFQDEPSNEHVGYDANDNLFFAASYTSSIRSGTGHNPLLDIKYPGSSNSVKSKSGSGIILMKYSNGCDRQLAWTKEIYATTGTTVNQVRLAGLEVADNGDFFIAGYYDKGNLVFGNGKVASGTSSTTWKGFVARFDNSGTCQDLEMFSGPNAVNIWDIALDAANDRLYLAGYHDYNNSAGSSANFTQQISVAANKDFLIEMDVSGNSLNFFSGSSYHTTKPHHNPYKNYALACNGAGVYWMEDTEVYKWNHAALNAGSSTINFTSSYHANDGLAYDITASPTRVAVTGLFNSELSIGSLSITSLTSGGCAFVALFDQNLVPLYLNYVTPSSQYTGFGWTISASIGKAIALVGDAPILGGAATSMAFAGGLFDGLSQNFICKFDSQLNPKWMAVGSGGVSMDDGGTVDIATGNLDMYRIAQAGNFTGTGQTFGDKSVSLGGYYYFIPFVNESVDFDKYVRFKGTPDETENPEVAAELSLENEEIKIYPNPTDGQIQVRGSEDAPIGEVVIFSSNGKKVFSKTVEENNISIDLRKSGLERGLYILKLSSSNYVSKIQLR